MLTISSTIFQKKEYEAALVGAFRREKDKDIALQALVAENQATLQLVSPKVVAFRLFDKIIY